MIRVWTSIVAAALALVPFAARPAAADIKVDATYEISIAGWGIARAEMDLTLDKDRYSADIFMRPKGVATIVTAVRTSVSADGRATSRGDVLPSNYSVSADEIARPVRVTMKMSNGNVTSLRAQPPLKDRPGRVAVTEAHKRGVVDPLSSGLIPAKAPDARDACDHTMKIFDGWTRYDVKLYYKGRRHVETKGYSGTASICGARWVPVAGHRPAKPEVQYLARNKALEVTMVPLPGSGYAIPYAVRIGTPNGEILIEPSALAISGTGV
ncbi:DUF3108 domain-containing protein [Acuticoccus sp. I52.16.1]|uniref:DUF3108 domain-containing protein n=1 Tax=Acuticoccus sp. I52.16.1 TaxID=2928472 RepID=UPI001FD52622|nr:DUF3108 domain-containing protein [Acuticoccus sp. I52.16.1]UOM32782.1 DUF3108 domain-containing protein [Acuticoccus sp. I52.16.1]